MAVLTNKTRKWHDKALASNAERDEAYAAKVAAGYVLTRDGWVLKSELDAKNAETDAALAALDLGSLSKTE